MRERNLLFWAACLGILCFGMTITTLGSVVPDLKTGYNLNDIGIGTLFTILPFGILLGSLLFGPVCDRYGYKLLLFFSCVFMFLGFIGIAYAPSHLVLKVSVFLFGLGGGSMNGSTSALVSDISEKGKGANLALLGVFFSIGALGMPFLLSLLRQDFPYQSIISIVGIFTFIVGLLYLILKFPPPKHKGGFPIRESIDMLKNGFLLLVSFFLFFQSAYESLINNWITTYLDQHGMEHSKALIVLSFFSIGMGIMRLLLGSVFRNTKPDKIWIVNFSLMIAGLLFIQFGNTFLLSTAGVVLVGAGLAGGFPLMLGYLGERFKSLSGTAFSFAFTIALLGNMIINYTTGVLIQYFGINQWMVVATTELACMIIICIVILKKLKTNNQ